MAGIGPFGDVGQLRLVNTVGRPAFEHEAAVAISAIDITMLVNFQIDARMAECRRAVIDTSANIAGAVTADAAGGNLDHFGRWDVHGKADNPFFPPPQAFGHDPRMITANIASLAGKP